MEKILKILRIFVIGGCVGITMVNIGHIIDNNIDGILLEETNRMAIINLVQFLLFGTIFAVAGKKIRSYRLTASVDKRIKVLTIHRIVMMILCILSMITLILTWYYDINIILIVSSIIVLICSIVIEIWISIKLKLLRHKIFIK